MTRPHGSVSHRPTCPTGPTCDGATDCARGEAFAELHETADNETRRANAAIPPCRHRLATGISVQSSIFGLVGKVSLQGCSPSPMTPPKDCIDWRTRPMSVVHWAVRSNLHPSGLISSWVRALLPPWSTFCSTMRTSSIPQGSQSALQDATSGRKLDPTLWRHSLSLRESPFEQVRTPVKTEPGRETAPTVAGAVCLR
jgi:hypothetical protein